MRIFILIFAVMLMLLQAGCLVTKVVTIPMRVAGEVVGFVPVIGGVVEGAVDTTAGAVDLAPL